jgi:hypothetical protein
MCHQTCRNCHASCPRALFANNRFEQYICMLPNDASWVKILWRRSATKHVLRKHGNDVEAGRRNLEQVVFLSGQTRRRRLRPIASGFQESATEQGIGSGQRLNVEGCVNSNETSDIKEGLGGEC